MVLVRLLHRRPRHVGHQPARGRVLPPELVSAGSLRSWLVAGFASGRLASDRSILARAFCEYKYLGITNAFGHGSKTEVVNTATNIFYLIFAAVGFYMSRKADPLIKLQCAFLMCTG